MKTERRALTAKEAQQVTRLPEDSGHFAVLLGVSALVGIVCGGIIGLIANLVTRYTRLLAGWVSDGGEVVLGFAAGLAISMFTLVSEWRKHRAHLERRRIWRENLLLSDDLLFENHKLIDVMLVRDPEHGQPMYFAKTAEEKIFYIFNGQDELDDDWDSHPLHLKEDEQPRAGLKVIRDPKTNESILVEFEGKPTAVKDCYIINRDPEDWPDDGQLMRGKWETLPKRYQLEKMDPAGI